MIILFFGNWVIFYPRLISELRVKFMVLGEYMTQSTSRMYVSKVPGQPWWVSLPRIIGDCSLIDSHFDWLIGALVSNITKLN